MSPAARPRLIAYAGEPGAFAEDAVLAASATSTRVSLGSFREVFEAVAAGDGRRRRGPDRERHQRHGPRELRPAARARPRDPRRGRRAGRALPGGPARASGSTTSSASIRTSRRSGRRRRSCARGRGSSCRPTTPPAPARPSRIAASAAPRPSSRRGPPPCSASRSWPTGSATCRATGPGSWSWPGPAPVPPALRPTGDAPPDDARGRRPQRTRDAAGGPAGHRGARPEHAQARVAARAASGPGSTCSGSTSTGTSADPAMAAALAELAGGHHDAPRPRVVPGAPEG